MGELDTIVQQQYPIKVVILNNRALGMVFQWQNRFYGRRDSHVLYKTSPNFAMIAQGFGVDGRTLTNRADLKSEIQRLYDTPGPALLDARVDKLSEVYPMMEPGKGPGQMVTE
jgi:acetolactate synthase-1/2/3 large subunit